MPIIFYCENNLYGMSTSIKRHMNIENIATRAASYGIEGISIDGYNPIEVYETVQKLLRSVEEEKDLY